MHPQAMPALSLDCLVSELISLSLEAGDLIRTVLRTMDLNVEMKGKDDPMTIVSPFSPHTPTAAFRVLTPALRRLRRQT